MVAYIKLAHFLYVYVHICAYMYIYVHICAYMHSAYMPIYVHICTYTYRKWANFMYATIYAIYDLYVPISTYMQ